ncbi:hypothetical protein M409DRAFT_68456 [Zasmidium cellare ATCC 36951]|uniref:Uncharacterized protein n=1 Tax=Zasmidium cellare ATCC 36951 TaxID=1080233 RepID=A0A6A6CDM8_ZASCE|nr:uncharacterized protein M409DRAFT_68456 [Zasmidium cellare ATCC 36951]KAF2163536.1 hypothetical protein M409DRAFT_68456 [Zasmidium cellare ATCC 36951]
MSSTTTVTRESAMIPDQQQSSLDQQARRHVKTTVNYWKSDADRTPAMDKSKPFLDRKMAFVRYQMDHEDVQPVLVHDIRGREDDFTLDKQGFQLCRRQIQTQSFTDEEHIKDSYYKEVENLLKETTGATKIHIYDHHIRSLSFEASLTAPPIEDSLDLPGPVRSVHIDDTPASARLVIRKNFPPSEAAHLLATPFSLINVWRPLAPVRKDPLALADARTVQPHGRVEALLPTPDGEDIAIYQIRASAEHRWWFVSEQRPEEVWLFKIFDSDDEGGFLGVPDTSFVERGTEGAEVRESVEVRCLCFFEGKGV